MMAITFSYLFVSIINNHTANSIVVESFAELVANDKRYACRKTTASLIIIIIIIISSIQSLATQKILYITLSANRPTCIVFFPLGKRLKTKKKQF